MIYETALEFFARWGRVAQQVERLKSEPPTEAQLAAAIRSAVSQGQSLDLANQAAEAIRKSIPSALDGATP